MASGVVECCALHDGGQEEAVMEYVALQRRAAWEEIKGSEEDQLV